MQQSCQAKASKPIDAALPFDPSKHPLFQRRKIRRRQIPVVGVMNDRPILLRILDHGILLWIRRERLLRTLHRLKAFMRRDEDNLILMFVGRGRPATNDRYAMFFEQTASVLPETIDVRINPARMIGENAKLIDHLLLIS